MITFREGNLLEAEVEAVVNTVNTVGVMGKGIALMFKERFPDNFKAYRRACKEKEVRIGHMFVTASNELSGPRWIINFPTKEHWKAPSRMEWIEAGLQDLQRVLREKEIRSVAIPPLGCGNGGLDWVEVRARIEEALGTRSPSVTTRGSTCSSISKRKQPPTGQLWTMRSGLWMGSSRLWAWNCSLLWIGWSGGRAAVPPFRICGKPWHTGRVARVLVNASCGYSTTDC
jgi:O-acetyl-ADP-ribose deacetylase (regulator of RNase III)